MIGNPISLLTKDTSVTNYRLYECSYSFTKSGLYESPTWDSLKITFPSEITLEIFGYYYLFSTIFSDGGIFNHSSSSGGGVITSLVFNYSNIYKGEYVTDSGSYGYLYGNFSSYKIYHSKSNLPSLGGYGDWDTSFITEDHSITLYRRSNGESPRGVQFSGELTDSYNKKTGDTIYWLFAPET